MGFLACLHLTEKSDVVVGDVEEFYDMLHLKFGARRFKFRQLLVKKDTGDDVRKWIAREIELGHLTEQAVDAFDQILVQFYKDQEPTKEQHQAKEQPKEQPSKEQSKEQSKEKTKEKTKEKKEEKAMALDKIKYIDGPVSMSRHTSARHPHIFYILGDVHDWLDGCPMKDRKKATTLDGVIASIVDDKKNHDKVIDVFSESNLTEIKGAKYQGRDGRHHSPLDNFHLSTRACLRQDQEVCWILPGRVRFHAVDTRLLNTNVLADLTSAFRYLGSRYRKNLRKREKDENNEDLDEKQKTENEMDRRDILVAQASFMLGPLIDKPDFDQYFTFEYCLNQPVVAKELKRVEDVKLREAIVGFMRDDFERQIIDDAESVRFLYHKLLKGQGFVMCGSMEDSLGDMDTAMMDLYALARMFRTKWKDGTPPPRNIIVYVGDYHADVYRDFLKSIGFDRKDAVVPGPKQKTQCVKVFDDDTWFDR